MIIELLEGQKVFGIDGKTYLIEKGDSVLIEDELHYSDYHKLALQNNGWTKVDEDTFTKTFKGGIVGGELNPTGKVVTYVVFDSSGRWIDVAIGFAGVDFDGRNYIEKSEDLVLIIEKEIMNYLKGKKTRFSIRGE